MRYPILLALVSLFLVGTEITAQAEVFKNCRVNSVFQLELERLHDREQKILLQCAHERWENDLPRCQSALNERIDSVKKIILDTNDFYQKNDWLNTAYYIRYDQTGNTVTFEGKIVSKKDWLLGEKSYDHVSPIVQMRDFAGGGWTYYGYDLNDLYNSSEAGPGYSPDFYGYWADITNKSGQKSGFQITVYTNKETKNKLAIINHDHDDGQLSFECDVSNGE